jgi:hypothetical protein
VDPHVGRCRLEERTNVGSVGSDGVLIDALDALEPANQSDLGRVRAVTEGEMFERLKQYLQRHPLAHSRQRLVDQLPTRRSYRRVAPQRLWPSRPNGGSMHGMA